MDHRELTLAELLADPIALAVMAADRVDPAAPASDVVRTGPQASGDPAGRTNTGLRRAGRSAVVDFFIHRSTSLMIIAVIMILTGLIAYNLLPVAQFPDITPPQVVVTTTYPGASSQIVANTVTTPLEQQING